MARRSRVTSIDVEIGLRLRRIRLDCGLTQEELGEKIGVSYQQVQKYETGQNRVSAGRLWHIAHLLSCPVDEFLPDDGFRGTIDAAAAGRIGFDAPDRERRS